MVSCLLVGSLFSFTVWGSPPVYFFVKLVVMLTVHGFLPVSGCEVRGFVAFSFLFFYLRRNCSFMGLRSSGVGVFFCVERVSFK